MLPNQVVIAVFEIFGNKCSFLDHFRVFSSITNVFFELVNARELVGNLFFFHKIFPQQGQETNLNAPIVGSFSCCFKHIRQHLRTSHRNTVSTRMQQLPVRCENARTQQLPVQCENKATPFFVSAKLL